MAPRLGSYRFGRIAAREMRQIESADLGRGGEPCGIGRSQMAALPRQRGVRFEEGRFDDERVGTAARSLSIRVASG